MNFNSENSETFGTHRLLEYVL